MVLKYVYNRFIRELLPRKIGVFNGVAVRDVHLLDRTDVFPNYEEQLMNRLREEVEPGDECVIVGGGRGVSTVIAARQSETGTVYCFEASNSSAELVDETAKINGVAGQVDVTNAVVGTAGRLWNDDVNGHHRNPRSLPDSDILVLDCNGAELAVLEEVVFAPRSIFVRVNGFLNVNENDVRRELQKRELSIVHRCVEVPENDIVLLVATRKSTEA